MYRVSLDKELGRPLTNEVDAAVAARQIRRAIQEGTVVPGEATSGARPIEPVVDRPTFSQVAAQYLERHVQRHLTPRTLTQCQYAHHFLATIDLPGPFGAIVAFPDKPFHLRPMTSSA